MSFVPAECVCISLPWLLCQFLMTHLTDQESRTRMLTRIYQTQQELQEQPTQAAWLDPLFLSPIVALSFPLPEVDTVTNSLGAI